MRLLGRSNPVSSIGFDMIDFGNVNKRVNPAKSLQKRNGEVPMIINFTTETVIDSDISMC